MKRRYALEQPVRTGLVTLAALALSACGGLIPAGEAPPGYGAGYGAGNTAGDWAGSSDGPPSQAAASSRQSTAIASAASGYGAHPGDRACLANLDAAGARFEPLPDTYAAPGCNKLGTVQLSALSGDEGRFGVSNLGPVKCETAKAFNDWARYGVDRAARQILGERLARIETMGSYACRTIAGSSRMSAHATGNAIDVSGFVLEDGRRIDLRSDWDGGDAATREFLRIVHKSACKRFGTVLGPEYNAAHKDHFHLEGTGARFCR